MLHLYNTVLHVYQPTRKFYFVIQKIAMFSGTHACMLKNLYNLIRRITLSTCILRAATAFMSRTSQAHSCSFFLTLTERTNLLPLAASSVSSCLKPTVCQYSDSFPQTLQVARLEYEFHITASAGPAT